jgi:mono/diheme cytochrome c family protein
MRLRCSNRYPVGLAVVGAMAVLCYPTWAVAQAAQLAADEIAAATTAEAPNFYTEVLPILQENCQACHQPAGLNMGGMVAPMSFVSYEETRPWAVAISKAVEERRMPPWHAARQHEGTFVGERYLEESEIAALVAWAEAGAPEGSPPSGWTPPPAAGEAKAWALGEPDLILRPDQPFCLEDGVEDVYINLPLTITREMLPEDRWIKSVEYRPGPHVHHVIQGDWGGLVPGAKPRVFENGYGRLLRAGPRDVTFNMHYNKPVGAGTAACDHTEVGIRFMEEGEVIKYVTGGDNLRIRDFEIPAGNSSYSASMEYTFERDVYLRSFMPHMHLRGKAALYEITYPNGQHEVLLHVPNYDFNWQHTYEFTEPRLVPQGSTLRLTMWWDNSEANLANPDPTVSVVWGLPTHAEMAQGYMNWREIEERQIVVGEPIPKDLLRDASRDEVEDDAHVTGAH